MPCQVQGCVHPADSVRRYSLGTQHHCSPVHTPVPTLSSAFSCCTRADLKAAHTPSASGAEGRGGEERATAAASFLLVLRSSAPSPQCFSPPYRCCELPLEIALPSLTPWMRSDEGTSAVLDGEGKLLMLIILQHLGTAPVRAYGS